MGAGLHHLYMSQNIICDEIEEDEMDRTCSTQKSEMCLHYRRRLVVKK
jgi:hypothetical protein